MELLIEAGMSLRQSIKDTQKLLLSTTIDLFYKESVDRFPEPGTRSCRFCEIFGQECFVFNGRMVLDSINGRFKLSLLGDLSNTLCLWGYYSINDRSQRNPLVLGQDIVVPERRQGTRTLLGRTTLV